jgi:hypothetical protein
MHNSVPDGRSDVWALHIKEEVREDCRTCQDAALAGLACPASPARAASSASKAAARAATSMQALATLMPQLLVSLSSQYVQGA